MSLHDHSEALNDALNEARRVLEECGFVVVHARPTGSAYYGRENPADFDVLVLIGEQATNRDSDSPAWATLKDDEVVPNAIKALAAHQYEDCAYTAQEGDLGYEGEEYGSVWAAVRGGRINIILTVSYEWYIRAAAATELTRRTSEVDGEVPPKDDIVEVFHICRFEE
ncbi:hypothetical protein RCIP0075_00039 [Klebsiella phage RCIP0075]